MFDHSETTVSNMAILNNEVVSCIDKSPVSPCEAIMVIDIIRASLVKAFELRMVTMAKEEECLKPGKE